MADLLPDARNEFGNCSLELLFSQTTDAINLLRTKSPAWDAMTAEMTICACNNIITLPRVVGNVMGCSVNDVPAIPRDAWYIYHINGTGPRVFSTPWYWDDSTPQGRPTIREFPFNCKLMAVPQYATDDGKCFRVFGTDYHDRPIFTLNADGTTSEGFLLTMNATQPMITQQPIKWIQRIVREKTNGYVKLYAINTVDQEMYLLGDYEPNETQPSYRRIRVQCKSRVRIRYKLAKFEIVCVNDFIPLDNKFSVVMAMQAIKFYRNKQYDQAAIAEATATRLCNEEQETRNVQSGIGPQVNVRDGAHNATLYAGVNGALEPGWGPGYGGAPGGGGM